jgi:hypothetical protein
MLSETYEKAAAGGNLSPRTPHNRALRIMAEIDRPHRYQHTHRASRNDHDIAFTAHSTACNEEGGQSPVRRWQGSWGQNTAYAKAFAAYLGPSRKTP